MVCIRLKSLLLGLLLSLATLRNPLATAAHQVIDALDNNQQALGANKELQVDGEAAAATSRKLLRGRKMEVQDLVKEVEGRVNTGANISVGKCTENENGGKRDLNIECELRVSRSSSPSSVKLAGLIPFSSDYHTPKTHPPKNN